MKNCNRSSTRPTCNAATGLVIVLSNAALIKGYEGFNWYLPYPNHSTNFSSTVTFLLPHHQNLV